MGSAAITDVFAVRRRKLYDLLVENDKAISYELATWLGWSNEETRSKLQSLRRAGLVEFDGIFWRAT
jgi:predicted ArsR family transcriptional regulator